MQIDTSTPFGARVEQRLRGEEVIWLTTVTGRGEPKPSPVWFLWDGETMLIYSQPGTPKVRNIAAHPAVALNFNTDEHGGDVVSFDATAEIVSDAPPADQHTAYLEKYREGIARIGSTPESMAQSYSTAIRVRLTKLRGY